jgi:hypothetical protein
MTRTKIGVRLLYLLHSSYQGGKTKIVIFIVFVKYGTYVRLDKTAKQRIVSSV